MRRRAFLLAAGAAVIAAPRVGATERAPSAAELARSLDPQRSAQDLVMIGEEGEALRIDRFAGKLVVLNLWGPWCAPCRREMPGLSRLARIVDSGRIVVAPLAFDWRGVRAVRAFYDELGIANLPAMTGKGDNLDAVLGLSRLPTTAIVDAKGAAFAVVAGEATWDDPATVEWLTKLAD